MAFNNPIMDNIKMTKARNPIIFETINVWQSSILMDKNIIAIVKTKENNEYFIDNNEFILI